MQFKGGHFLFCFQVVTFALVRERRLVNIFQVVGQIFEGFSASPMGCVLNSSPCTGRQNTYLNSIKSKFHLISIRLMLILRAKSFPIYHALIFSQQFQSLQTKVYKSMNNCLHKLNLRGYYRATKKSGEYFIGLDKIRTNSTSFVVQTPLFSFYSLLRCLLPYLQSALAQKISQKVAGRKTKMNEYPFSLRWPRSPCVGERASCENSVFRLIKNFILCTIFHSKTNLCVRKR